MQQCSLVCNHGPTCIIAICMAIFFLLTTLLTTIPMNKSNTLHAHCDPSHSSLCSCLLFPFDHKSLSNQSPFSIIQYSSNPFLSPFLTQSDTDPYEQGCLHFTTSQYSHPLLYPFPTHAHFPYPPFILLMQLSKPITLNPPSHHTLKPTSLYLSLHPLMPYSP